MTTPVTHGNATPAPASPPPPLPDDSAQWAALEAELGDDVKEPDAEPDTTEPEPAEPEVKEPDKQPAAKPTYEDIERNLKKVNAALRESRAQNKADRDNLRA